MNLAQDMINHLGDHYLKEHKMIIIQDFNIEEMNNDNHKDLTIEDHHLGGIKMININNDKDINLLQEDMKINRKDMVTIEVVEIPEKEDNIHHNNVEKDLDLLTIDTIKDHLHMVPIKDRQINSNINIINNRSNKFRRKIII